MSDGPFFFMSYARDDRKGDESKVIERFYADLETEVAALLGWTRPVGFMDSLNIKNGEDWSQELRAALSACRVFVPILSRRLFGRECCGQEWAYFEQRIHAAAQSKGSRPPLIQPVLLVGPASLDPIPSIVSKAQNRGDAFPERYNESGLRTVVRLHADREYREFLQAFAERLVDVYTRHGAPPEVGPPRLEELPNAFFQVEDKGAVSEHTSSPRVAQLYYIAGTRDELSTLRTYVDCYGETSADWQPYMPHIDEPVGVLAPRVASDENLIAEWIRLDDEDLIERLDKAKAMRTMAILLVDAWTLRLPRYRALMQTLDERIYPNIAILIPNNPEDPERDHYGAGGDVGTLFVNRMVSSDKDQFAQGIASPAELKTELARKLQTAKSRIEKTMEICRRASGDGPASLPVIGSGSG